MVGHQIEFVKASLHNQNKFVLVPTAELHEVLQFELVDLLVVMKVENREVTLVDCQPEPVCERGGG